MTNPVSTALHTDLYQLTMAQGYWKQGLRDRMATFHLSFRKHPFGGAFTVAAGLAQAVEWIEAFSFDSQALAYLQSLQAGSGVPLFEPAFLQYLGTLRFTGEVSAIPEGTLVFPHTPLVRVTAPLIEAQLLETALLTLINYQTLIATKAARIVLAAQGDPVLEFGLRRAHGLDGGLSASRAAFIGGCMASSNVMAGYQFGIPVKGTHAHSWVMVFEEELAAFEAYAGTYPNSTVLLVDTYDTLQGVEKAITIGRRLRKRGFELAGIRLDSGDLERLSVNARMRLDQAGFSEVKIVASNDLDEYAIAALKQAHAPIDTWGVGTRLVTAYDQPALGGVYKLGALQTQDGAWRYTVKQSEQASKTSNPGRQALFRIENQGRPIADLLQDISEPIPPPSGVLADGNRWQMPTQSTPHSLLQPILKGGQRIRATPPLRSIQQRTRDQLAQFGINEVDQSLSFPVVLSPHLYAEKMRLMRKEQSVS